MRVRHTVSKTIEYQLWIGLQEGYDGPIHTVEEAENICQEYVDRIGWGITVTPTKFIYKGGSEQGVVVGVINYPRFDVADPRIVQSQWGWQLYHKLLPLAKILMDALGQIRCTIVGPEYTIMLEREEE